MEPGGQLQSVACDSDSPTTVYHCALHSRLGSAAAGKTAHFEHKSAAKTWRELKSELEQRLLGRSVEADCALEQRARQQRRLATRFRDNVQSSSGRDREQRAHQQQLKAKVVGSSREQRPGGDDWTVDEVRRRAQVLPWLSARALLEPGDIIVLWRLPRLYDITQRIYNSKAAQAAHSAKNVPKQYQHLLRLQLAAPHRPGATFGEHQWLAERAARTESDQNLQFEKDMDEDERIALLTERAAQEYGVSTGQTGAACSRFGRGVKRQRQWQQPKAALPPQNYICVRCNLPGHWVQDCPTRHDARFEPRNILSTNGIARSRLRRVQLCQLAEDFDEQLYRDQEGRFYVQHHSASSALRAKRKREVAEQVLLNPSSL